ncbi:MAG: N-acetylmuramoyl-L-alanine amidase [Lachnospiraceae bacterium]|nr:N-acetylmuramoyl-L-alanine amidase [Lachnospiraceae bacterium]MDE6184827.1 N-acetylmuramoyl-L-alanine amidase [Lachnospiraceae bacterium]
MIAARMVTLCFLVSLIVIAAVLLIKLIEGLRDTEEVINDFQTTVESQKVIEENKADKPIMTEDFIPINEYSRPGETLPEVNNIFVHYTANPGTSAAQNRSYFENLGITGETSASAHFVIGYNGEIIQCIPLNEIAYAVAGRNYDSISIECCYLSEDGKFTDDTYQSLIRLSAWLLKEYNLAPEDMRRHYDEGGKKCPLYFVENTGSWQQFLNDLEDYIIKEQK